MIGAALVLILAGFAAGQKDPRVPDLPPNSLNGGIFANYSCSLPFFGPQVFKIYFTGFAPNVLAPGQAYSFTGGNGYLIMNSNVTYGANILGGKSADGNVTELQFATYTGSQNPSTYNALPATIQLHDVTWTVGAELPLKLPPSGTINTPAVKVGGTAGSITAVQIGDAAGVVQLKNAKGQNVQMPLSVNCTKPSPPLLLATINVEGSSNSSTFAVTPGSTNFDTIGTPLGYQRGSFRFPTTCTFTGLSGTRSIDLYLSAALPVQAKAGSSFSFTNGTGVVRFPKSVVSELVALHSGATQATGSVSQFLVGFSKTSQGSVNVASTPLSVPATSLSGNSAYDGDVVIVLPSSSSQTLSGTVNVNGGTSGQLLSVSAGAASGSFNLLNANGAQVGSTVSVSCTAPGTTLIDVPIA